MERDEARVPTVRLCRLLDEFNRLGMKARRKQDIEIAAHSVWVTFRTVSDGPRQMRLIQCLAKQIGNFYPWV